MGCSQLKIQRLFIISCLYFLVYAQKKCSLGIETKGFTYPTGDINMEYGSGPLDIICSLTDEDYIAKHPLASSELSFQRNREHVSPDKISILNATSIMLHEENPEKSTAIYSCVLGAEAVCLNNVAIGTKPQKVDDFECKSLNYENLTCEWTPKKNYITTNYSLSYTFPHTRAGNRPSDCPQDKPEYNANNNTMRCFWNIHTTPQYRLAHEHFNFTLTIENVFGKVSQSFLFEHYKNIHSNPPENLKAENTTISSIFISWSIPTPMMGVNYELEHRILYQCEHEPKKWKFASLLRTVSHIEKVYYNLTGIEHAHAMCDIRVGIKVTLADDEKMWSNNASITVRTKSDKPGAPPRTTIGSFEVISSTNSLEYRNVYLYWQQIPLAIRNGENLTYSVFSNDSRIENVELTSAYAKFKNLSNNSAYKFRIRTKNAVGYSKDESHIIVPSLMERFAEPLSFTKVAYETSGFYELSWVKPKTDKLIMNYTLFSCSHERDRPYQCTGYLNWTVVSNETYLYNVTVIENQTTQFAIAANGEHSSSGMVWASCTVIHNKAIGKMKDVWIRNISSDFIDVGWKLDCSDRIGSLEGFIIYYCKIVHPSNRVCKDSVKNLTIAGDASVTGGKVTGLTPYTIYMLNVAVKSKNAVGLQSDPVYNVTLEGAPSKPYDLKVTDFTNSSITVSWKPPNKTNGVIKNYVIYFNHDKREINKEKIASDKPIYTLTNLTSFETFNVTIAACTTACSQRAVPVQAMTKIGYPSKIPKPTLNPINASLTYVEWKKPAEPGGKIDLYELRFKENHQGDNVSLHILNQTDNKYSVDCGSNGRIFYISVRAVNIHNGTRYEGPWSDDLFYNKCTENYMFWVIIFLSCVGVVIFFYIGKRVYMCCQNMRNVGIKLPEGLDPKNTETWPNQKTAMEINHTSSADEEHLLQKMSDGKHSGDTSGCSSGQDVSSLKSGSSISGTSDSGTENPRTSTSEEPFNSIHFRGVPANKEQCSKAYVTMPTENLSSTWSLKGSPTGNYCMFGDPNLSPETDTTYITNISQPDVSLQYESMFLNDNESVNTGYVPIKNDTDGNPVYVIAGNKAVIPEHRPVPINDQKSMYVQVSDVNGGIKGVPDIQPPPQQKPDLLPTKSSGYVSCGDAPPRIVPDLNKYYVPHRHFEPKALQED